jgi:hypothetical protein
MPEPTARHAPATTQPQPVLNDSAPPRRPDPAASRQLPARLGGMRGALITQVRQVMRRGRRKSNAG